MKTMKIDVVSIYNTFRYIARTRLNRQNSPSKTFKTKKGSQVSSKHKPRLEPLV